MTRGAIGIWLVGACAIAVTWQQLLNRVRWFRFDDAYITLVYARNLALHGIPSFRLDAAIDGYTSPLWVLLLAACQHLGLAPDASMLWLSRGSGLIACWLAAFWAMQLGARPVLAVAIAGFGSITAGFLAWSAPGMETPAVAVTALGWFIVETSEPGRLRAREPLRILIGSLAVLTRPENVVLLAVFAALEFWRNWRQPGSELARGWRFLSPAIWTILGLFGLWFVLHWVYYGYPLPNTYYAKPSTPGLAARGWADARLFLGQRSSWVATVAAVVLALRPTRARAPLLAFALWFALTISAYARVGGDYLGCFRYYQPLIPAANAVLATLASLGLNYVSAQLSARTQSALAALLSLCTVALGLWLTTGELRRISELDEGELRTASRDVENWEQVGWALRAHYPAGTRIAVRAAGVIPWASGLVPQDVTALNEPRVSHHNRPVRDIPGHQLEATTEQILQGHPDVIVAHPWIVPHGYTPQPTERRWADAGYHLRCLPLNDPNHDVCVWTRAMGR